MRHVMLVKFSGEEHDIYHDENGFFYITQRIDGDHLTATRNELTFEKIMEISLSMKRMSS